MDFRDHLTSLYEEWRLMSEVEGEAIRSASWNEVQRCQGSKALLQTQIVSATEELNMSSLTPEEIRNQFRPILEHLINLEIRNNQLLGETRSQMETERDQLDKKQRNLRQIKSAYGGGTAIRF